MTNGSERAKERKAILESVWGGAGSLEDARAVIQDTDAASRCSQLLEAHKEQAIRTLPALRNPSLKGLLRRVIGKIFTLEVQGWCSEFETRNAAGRTAGAEVAG